MIDDPDYARAFSKARCIAWSYGWCLVQHGTATRDLDVVMIPWTEQAAPAEGVVRYIAKVVDMDIPHPPGPKPHGRTAWGLMFKGFGDPQWIDLSVMPRMEKPTPIDMVLHCPVCGLQHVDAAEVPELDRVGLPVDPTTEWTNPPHRSHLCAGCGHVWRPADVPTNGVAAVTTTGKRDHPIHHPVCEPLMPTGAVLNTTLRLNYLGRYATCEHTGDPREAIQRLIEECRKP